MSCWIYFVLVEGERIKIGRTNNLKKRIMSLANPQAVRVDIRLLVAVGYRC